MTQDRKSPKKPKRVPVRPHEMTDDDSYESAQPVVIPATPGRKTVWARLGGGALSISILFHVALLVLGAFWIFKVIHPPEKTVDFMPPAGGGGSPEASSQEKARKKQLMQPTLSRVAALNVTSSNITLPEPDPTNAITSLGDLGGGALSKGKGGTGSGGGFGSGNGPGNGSGVGPGKGGMGLSNPFGMLDPSGGGLTGTFYDLKQTVERDATNMTDDEMRLTVREIVSKGFKEKQFEKYYHASQKLYQTKLYMPTMPADGAPAAFNCEKEVQPRRWIVVYRGVVKAPKTGKFRFVGACDDLLAVRFNNHLIFDYGYTMACTGVHMFGRAGDVDGSRDVPDLAKDIKKMGPMKVPIEFYKYETSPNYNDNIGGFAVGPEFQVREGSSYPIEILIGEIPGGFFGVSLMIEEIGAKYEKASTGAPILPLFRLDNSLPDPKLQGPAAQYATDGPIWKLSGSGTALGSGI